MEENKCIILSYSTLFELLRTEKDREELQKLEQTFFDDVKSYIQSRQKDTSTLNNFEEKNKIEKELYNLKKILKELYEKRERKIVSMALDKSRIKTNIIDNSSMLKEEKELFDSLVGLLDENRQYVALRLFSQEQPTEPRSELKPTDTPEVKSVETKEEAKQIQPAPEPEIKEPDTSEKKDTKLVRFVNAVPKFVGKELEEYGPFEEEDVANLPLEIAQLLIDKQRAEEIEQ